MNQNAGPPSPRLLLAAFVLPLVIYSLGTALEPAPRPPAVVAVIADADTPLVTDSGIAADDTLAAVPAPAAKPSWLPPEAYPYVFAGKVVAAGACLLYFWPVYRREFPPRLSSWGFVVGVVGVVAWIGLWHLHAEEHLVTWLGGPDASLVEWLGLGPRPAFNPLDTAGDRGLAYAFLALRFVGLVLLVPIIEELFLRAFFMRYVMHDNWWQIPFGDVNTTAVIAGLALPVLYHPEKLSALVWFAMMTWLMVRTRNFWDCVVAHAVTNLLLGIYVVMFGVWELW